MYVITQSIMRSEEDNIVPLEKDLNLSVDQWNTILFLLEIKQQKYRKRSAVTDPT